MLTPRARYRWQCLCRASYRNKKSGSILGGVLHIFGLPSLRAVCVDFHTAREEDCGEGEALQGAVFGEGDPDELLCVAYRGKDPCQDRLARVSLWAMMAVVSPHVSPAATSWDGAWETPSSLVTFFMPWLRASALLASGPADPRSPVPAPHPPLLQHALVATHSCCLFMPFINSCPLVQGCKL